MLSQHIAEKIQAKVEALINQSLSVTGVHGQVLANSNPAIDEAIDLKRARWAIGFSYGGKPAGYVVLSRTTPNYDEIKPLIQSIAELILHQQVLIEQIPHQDERLDKFIYDLLLGPADDELSLTTEGKLFDIDLQHPRIIIMVKVDDPKLGNNFHDPAGDRELRISRYKSGIGRALQSYYTSSRDNIVSYIGGNSFCILKDLGNGGTDLDSNLVSFKKSTANLYDILKSELKLPTTVGVGNYHPGVRGLRRSYEEAASAIELGASMWESDRIYHIDDFGVVAPLLSGVDDQNTYFSRDLLDQVGYSADTMQTLETFFNFDMSLTRTSEHLKIHRNTLVYRLDRISQSLGLDPRRFDDAVQIKLALIYRKFTGAANED